MKTDETNEASVTEEKQIKNANQVTEPSETSSTSNDIEVTKRKVILGYISMIGVMIFLFAGVNAGLSPQIPLVTASALAVALAIFFDKQKWADIEKNLLNSLSVTNQAIIIIMIIGILIAAWIAGGIVPTLIYYGLSIINPKLFFVTALILSAIISLAVGSSWTTAGTVGVALVGIAIAFGITPGLAAGAIISGAYFGDKMSPLSDTTNLAPAVSGSNLFDHIKSMSYTTIPTILVVIVIYFVIGLRLDIDSSSLQTITDFKDIIGAAFYVSPLLLIPPVLIIVMVLFKVPALPGLIVATALGVLSALTLQDGNTIVGVAEMLQSGYVFDPTPYEGLYPAKTVEDITSLLSNGGLDSMMWTISLVICAMCFGGVMEGAGFLEGVISVFNRFTKSRTSLIATSVATGIIINIVVADQYLAIIFPGRMFRSRFEALKIQPAIQSRVLEASGTVTSVLVPWNTCGVAVSGFLGVPTIEYLPYAFFNIMSPFVEILASAVDYKMEPIQPSTGKREKKAKN